MSLAYSARNHFHNIPFCKCTKSGEPTPTRFCPHPREAPPPRPSPSQREGAALTPAPYCKGCLIPKRFGTALATHAAEEGRAECSPSLRRREPPTGSPSLRRRGQGGGVIRRSY